MTITAFSLYPGATTFPGFTLFPGSSAFPGTPLGTSATMIALQSDDATVILNSVDGSGVKWVVKQFDGWGSAAPTIDVVQKPRQSGGWAGLSYARPRFVRLGVTLYAPNATSLNTALDSLYAAVSLGDALLTVAEAGLTRSLTVRRSDEVLHTRVTSRVAEVQLQMVAVDPRKIGGTLTGASRLPYSFGGLTIPFTVPYAINSTVVIGQVNLTNTGNTTGPVVLRIDGPCVGPVITHSSATTTKSLVFSSALTLTAGEYLLVDMDRRLALGNGQATRAGYVTSRGWSGFDPGANTWTFAASGYDTNSLLSVSASPAWA